MFSISLPGQSIRCSSKPLQLGFLRKNGKVVERLYRNEPWAPVKKKKHHNEYEVCDIIISP